MVTNNAVAPITTNNWVHVVVTRVAPLKDATDNGSINIYINGSLISTTIPSNNQPIRLTQVPTLTTIGAQRWGGGNPSTYMKNGSKIDALNVWDRVITESEISQLYNGGNGKQYPK